MFLGQTFSRVAVEDEKRDAIRILLIGGGVCKSSVLMQTLDQEIVLREPRITPTTAQCKLRVNPFFMLLHNPEELQRPRTITVLPLLPDRIHLGNLDSFKK